MAFFHENNAVLNVLGILYIRICRIVLAINTHNINKKELGTT